jgi:hypothetical protein
MTFSLPANYDWSSTSAPTGSFGVESIPGSESVLNNLSGSGALGTKGILNFLNGFGGGSKDLNNLNRFAGGLGSLLGPGFDIAASTKALEDMAKKTTSQIDERISNIYPNLTGLTGSDMVYNAYKNLAGTVRDVANQGYANLQRDPDISTSYDRLSNRVDSIQNQYSLANRIGGYEKLALDPSVVSMDVGSIRGAADWSAPEIASQYGMLTDYSGPQASKFIYGNRGTADAIGKYYNTSGDVAGLMNYGTLA